MSQNTEAHEAAVPEAPGMAAFDALDDNQMGAGAEQTPISEIFGAIEAKEESPEEPLEETDKDEVSVPGEDDSEEAEDTEESGEPDESKEEDEAPEPDEVDPPTVIKTKHNDTELELYGDIPIPTQVAGKTETPTLQELRENYSGKVNWNRKFEGLANDKKEYQKERIAFDKQTTEMNQLVTQIVDAARGDDPFQFFDVIAEIVGTDPVKLKREVVENQIRSVEPVTHMSEDERAQWLERQELQWERQRIERHKRARTQEEESVRNNARINEVRDKYGISEDEYRESYSLAEKNLTDQKPSVEHVVWIHRHQMATQAVQNVRADWVNGLNPDSETDVAEYERYVGNIREMARNNPEFTREDLEEIIREAESDAENTSAAKLSRKVSKATGQGVRVGGKKAQPKRTHELTSFDQLYEQD